MFYTFSKAFFLSVHLRNCCFTASASSRWKEWCSLHYGCTETLFGLPKGHRELLPSDKAAGPTW